MLTVASALLVVQTRTADGLAGVIAGERLALAVDAGIDDGEGASVLAAARSLARDTVWLAYTHGHVDHALGGTAFRGHEIIASPAITRHMRAQLDDWSERSGEPRAELAARIGWPTIEIERGGALDLGGRRVELLDTPGHAPGAICVLDRDAGVLFGGDTVVTAIPPYFADGDSGVLEATLRTLAALDLEILVPGHGTVVRGGSEIRAAITWEADYLARCRDHVARHAHEPIEAVLAAAPYDGFVGAHLPRDRHRMEWRHERAVRRIHEEIVREGRTSPA